MTGTTLLFLVPLLVVAALLALGVAALGRGGTASADGSKPTDSRLLSAAERSFYRVLCGVAVERFVVFVKVAPAAVLGTKEGLEQLDPLDFVLCDPETTVPVLVIAFGKGAAAGDHALAQACEAASLPLLRVLAAKRYDAEALRARIEAALHAADV